MGADMTVARLVAIEPARFPGDDGESAWGPDADRRARPLILQTRQGSLDDADLQTSQRQIVRLRESKLPRQTLVAEQFCSAYEGHR